MNKRLGLSALVAVAVSASAFAAQAQGKAVELSAGLLGVSGISCSGCTNTTTISTGGILQGGALFGIGGAEVSAGFYLSPGLAIEPSLTLIHVSGGGESAGIYTIGVGLPIYFQKGWGRKGWYATPKVMWNDYTCSGCTSTSTFGVGAAVGYKVPLNENGALRIEGVYDYGFSKGNASDENFIPQISTYGLNIGLSVFIK